MAALGSLLGCLALTLAWAVPPAGAVQARPQVYTGEANAISTTSATLNGSIDPSNQLTDYYFQYGPTLAYGAQTPTLVAGEGTQSLHVSAQIAGLPPGSSYHFRLVALNPTGSTDGADRTFATKKIPLTLTLSALPASILFKSPFTVSGTLTGTENAQRKVVLQANPFPYLAGFGDVGSSVTTDASGAFSLHVEGLAQSTELRVATVETPPVASSVSVTLVAVKVSLHVTRTGRPGFVRLHGTVTPSEVGAQVSIQLVRNGRPPKGVATTLVKAGTPTVSRYSLVLPIGRRSLYRAMVYVRSGAQVANHSQDILIR